VKPRIPYTKPSITELEARYATDAAANGWTMIENRGAVTARPQSTPRKNTPSACKVRPLRISVKQGDSPVSVKPNE
jgi:hypothetical protein